MKLGTCDFLRNVYMADARPMFYFPPQMMIDIVVSLPPVCRLPVLPSLLNIGQLTYLLQVVDFQQRLAGAEESLVTVSS